MGEGVRVPEALAHERPEADGMAQRVRSAWVDPGAVAASVGSRVTSVGRA